MNSNRVAHPGLRITAIIRFVVLSLAMQVAVAIPAHAITKYSGASVGANGTIYGWSVTDAYQGGMWHTAYVTSNLRSPNGRVANSGQWSGDNWVRADVGLPWLNDDLGTYLATGDHRYFCYYIQAMILLAASFGSTQARMSQWIALTSDSTNTACGYKIRTRVYRGLDQYGWIPSREMWVLNETLTFEDDTCEQIDIGGSEYSVGTDDDLSIGCSNPSTCIFYTDQTYSVGFAPLFPTKLVKGKNCIGKTETQCIAQPQHTGWHTQVTATAIAVTDIP